MVVSWLHYIYTIPKNKLPVCLILYHKIPTFNDPGERSLLKRCGKRRKCCFPAFPPFPTMFSTQSVAQIIVFTTLNMSSAKAFKLDWSKFLSFGEELRVVLKVISTSMHGPVEFVYVF